MTRARDQHDATLFRAHPADAPGEPLKHHVLLVALIATLALAPAFATLPTADACQPDQSYCAIDGQLHYGCGTKIPSSCIMSILDHLP